MGEYWSEKKVLVTGATGMVGSWLVKRLIKSGASVVALVRDPDPQSELYRSGDIHKVAVVSGALEEFWALERAINENEIDTVFHLGAQTIVGTADRFPLPTFEANIRGTYNLLEACRLHAGLVRRVVLASSDKAYGEQATLPYTEEMPLQGSHPYEVSKSCADLIARAYFSTYGLPIAIARCGNVYGGGDLNWSRIVPGTVRSLLHGERPVVRSDGTFVRDYIYVEDVVGAYLATAEAIETKGVAGEAFNFSTESTVTVSEIVTMIQKLTGRTDLEAVLLNRARGEIRNQSLSCRKAREILGWRDRYDLEAGLRATLQWYEAFLGERR
ncbi:MAG: NAD-dependent epimerase/dehydratase family protein [Candidatus Rokuibacteriota bacterium]